jgi:hypothetical protein
VPVSSTGTGAVTLRNSIATQLGAIGTSGSPAASLSVTTSNDAVTQTADVFVAGATTVNAGTGDITLSRAGNDFQGNVSLTGGALSIADANNLAITTLSNDANKSITAVAQGTLALPAGPSTQRRQPRPAKPRRSARHARCADRAEHQPRRQRRGEPGQQRHRHRQPVAGQHDNTIAQSAAACCR